MAEVRGGKGLINEDSVPSGTAIVALDAFFSSTQVFDDVDSTIRSPDGSKWWTLPEFGGVLITLPVSYRPCTRRGIDIGQVGSVEVSGIITSQQRPDDWPYISRFCSA